MKIQVKIFSAILLIFILTPVNAISQISKRLDSLAIVHVEKGFNGNVLYSKNDSIIFTGNYGYRNYSEKKLLNDSTIFELASCSKQFTALAIVQLVEKNQLSYEDYVYTILKEFPYKNITVEHLLKHQSGLPDYQKILYNKKYWDRKKSATHKSVLNILKILQPSLEFVPGYKYDYNNTGYVILALIIEQISKQSYASYIKKHIFIPAKMHVSQVYNANKELKFENNIADGYTLNLKKGKYQKIELDKNHKHIHWMNGVIGGRGIYSSILDLEKWKRALKYNTLISEESIKKMTSIDSISKKYGYGFAIYNTKSKGKWVYHNGSWSGYKTMTLYLPKSNEYLVILSNNRYEETYKSFEEDLYKLISN